jgi:hypothetical protein
MFVDKTLIPTLLHISWRWEVPKRSGVHETPSCCVATQVYIDKKVLHDLCTDIVGLQLQTTFLALKLESLSTNKLSPVL